MFFVGFNKFEIKNIFTQNMHLGDHQWYVMVRVEFVGNIIQFYGGLVLQNF